MTAVWCKTTQNIPQLKPFNCEWLIRPKVTLSELAATVKGNFSLLAQIADDVNCELVENMAQHMSMTLDTIANFNDKETRQGASRKDLKELMRFFISQSQVGCKKACTRNLHILELTRFL